MTVPTVIIPEVTSEWHVLTYPLEPAFGIETEISKDGSVWYPRFIVHPEIREWIQKNLLHHCSISFVGGMTTKVVFKFLDENDAMHFKMRWS